ncbi:MAG: hypothetical protein JRG96_18550 [Deltaproteobacteria bacterium]|nr:hypothetical protein [Deltaproteobacteria bacterium]
MSPPTAEPRFRGRPTLPETAGLIAGILALAIALAPTFSQHDPAEGSRSAQAGRALVHVETAPPPMPVEEAVPSPDANLPVFAGSLAVKDRCSMGSLDGSPAAPGAYCPLPQREQEAEESRFVNLSIAWPRLTAWRER